jgi:hypothetical protein
LNHSVDVISGRTTLQRVTDDSTDVAVLLNESNTFGKSLSSIHRVRVRIRNSVTHFIARYNLKMSVQMNGRPKIEKKLSVQFTTVNLGCYIE